MTAVGLIQRSIYGGVLILAILTVRAVLLYRLPKRTFPILWGVALARLLLPFSFSSVFSVYSLLQPKTLTEAPGYIPYGTGENAVTAAVPAAWTAVRNTALGETALSAAGENRFPVLPAVWGIGAALCAIFFVRAYFRGLRDFRNAVPAENNRIRQWLNGHRTGYPIFIRQSDKITAPLTYGILHPVILLPERLIEENSPELEYVLQHEYVHIRRHDAALKLAMVTVLCIHWFNPLVWVMCGLLNRDIELACDEGVLRRFGEQSRAGYAMALIGMEEKKRRLLPLYNGFSKNATEERIVLIMKYKKTKRVTGIAALVLVVSVVLVFATSARTSEAAGKTDGGIVPANEPGAGTPYLSGTEPADISDTDMMNIPEADTVNVPMDPPPDSMSYDSSPEQPGTHTAPEPAAEEPENRAAAGSFSIIPAEADSELSESGKQLQQLAVAFWKAYLDGNTENIRQYLSADFDSDVDVFPDGIDGHVASEAMLQAVKGLDITDIASGETCVISLEFRPAAGADYLEYLTVTAVMDGDGWKVLSYGLEM